VRRHRADANQKQIVDELRACGVSVFSTSQVDNFVDLIAGFRGLNYLLEVKSDKGKLSEKQIKFRDEWAGRIIVVRKVDDFFDNLK
jgi:Holliday junction resolvase